MSDPERPCTALAVRPCTALVPAWKKCRLVGRCVGCGQWEHQCVCGTGVLSLGHKLAEKRERRFRKRMLDAMVDALRSLEGRHLVVLDPED